MKISKDKMIKLFKDSISKLEISTGEELSVSDNFSDKEINMSYPVNADNHSLGIMMLFATANPKEGFKNIEELKGWQSFGIKYFILFRPHSDFSPMSLNNEEKFKIELQHELSSNEFKILSKMFKKKLTEAEEVISSAIHSGMKNKLEMLSDEFNLDFFPKKRTVLIEKYKEPPVIYGVLQQFTPPIRVRRWEEYGENE